MKRAKISKDKLKKYWDKLDKLEDEFHGKVSALEKVMEKETGIEGIEFFWVDNEIVGIGNADRTMRLIHRSFHR